MSAIPPPLPTARASTSVRSRAWIYALAGSALFASGFIIGRMSDDGGRDRAPKFGGEATQEDFRRGAEWLLEQDRLRERGR